MSRLLTADQPQLFHEPASKPASHLVASPGCHCGDASCSAMQVNYLARLPSGFSGRFFQYL
ncbi:hypothetical protein AJR23_010805 [Shigella flexneri]|nr:hypothetical protein AJR23_010805 [Shigella flexneri]